MRRSSGTCDRLAHIGDDDVRMLPVVAGPKEFRAFLYVQQTSHWLERHVPAGGKDAECGVLVLRVGVDDTEVEPLSVPPTLRRHGRTAPGDLGAAFWGLDRGLVVLVPHQRPAERLGPEEPDLAGAVASDLAEEAATGQERVVGLDHAELVALGVGEHHVSLFGKLAAMAVLLAPFALTSLLLLSSDSGRLIPRPSAWGALVVGDDRRSAAQPMTDDLDR